MGTLAARVGDQVAHGNAMMGLLAGAALGAALAVAVVATGGLAAVAAGALIAGGLAGGALAGEYVGAASMGPPTGAITIGSPDVLIDGRPAAMTNIAMAICAKEYGAPQPIAQGAATVFINGMPAARKNDKLVCGAVIIEGSGDVFIDDRTVQTLEIAPEVPAWLNRTLEVVAIGAGVVGFGAAIAAVGFGAACAGLAGGLLGGWAGGKGGRALGQALGLSEAGQRLLEVGGGFAGGLLGGGVATKATEGFGTNAEGVVTPASDEVCTSGCPISMLTGEELLTLQDFSWPGPLTLAWTRFYRTAQSGIALQLGHGWLTPLDEWIEPGADGGLTLHDREGRRIALPLPPVGGYGVNTSERLRVEREAAQIRIRSDRAPDRLFAWGPGRRPLQAWSAAGHRIDLVRDGHGEVTALRASWGPALVIEREDGRIHAITPATVQPDGRLAPSGAPLVRYAYDDAGDLVAALDRLGEGERYAYANHLLTRRTLATGFDFRFEWDGPGPSARCLRNWGNDGLYDYRFEWNLSHGRSRAIDSLGGVTHYEHDAGGRLLRITSAEGRTERHLYDERGLLVEVAGPLGTIVRYEHDRDGRVVKAIDALGQATELAYDVQGRLARRVDPLGQAGTWRHDADGRLLQATDALGGVTSYAYNAQGLLTQVRNPVGQVRLLWWDAQARLVAEVGFDGLRRHFGHDEEGRIARVTTQDKRVVRYDWDAVGRLAAFTDAAGATTRLRHDARGQLTHWIGPDGGTTEYRYREGLAQPSERIDPLGRSLRYHYDSERNLIGLTNPKGERCELVRNRDGQLVEQVGFDGRRQRFGYDEAGRLVAKGEQVGQAWRTTRLLRDRLGRLEARIAPDGQVFRFGHDALGRLVQASTQGHDVVMAYDALGRLIEERQGDAGLRHTLDAIGRRTATTLPDGQQVGFEWSRFGRIEKITLDGRPISRHRWNEFAQEAEREQGELTSRYDYDPAGRIAAQSVDQGAHRLIGRDYSRDPTGRIAAIHDLRQGASRYGYDPAGQLLAVQGVAPERFVHDPAGNLLGEGEAMVEGDRLLMQGDRHFRYDEAGDRIEERRGSGGRLVTHYAYDGSHRLKSAQTPRGTSHYRYDALGRRIAKKTPQGLTRFYWDGCVLLGEASARDEGMADQWSRRWYVNEPGSFRPLACITRTPRAQGSEVLHYHLDHLGTPREMTDRRGRIVWSARYRAWGALALADVQEVDNPIRFQGQYHDAETGLHYNFQRYYDPAVGRYINQDPIGLAGGVNPYRYVPDPLGWVDPVGLACGEEGRAGNDLPFIYRGDARDPSTIFSEGFQPRGTNTDLFKYASQNEPSVYVSTSTSPNVASEFAGQQGGGFVYTIRGPSNGIDVNAVLGTRSPFPDELEIAVPGGIQSTDILGAKPVDADGNFVGPLIENPGYII